jgi:WD40 repeat protein
MRRILNLFAWLVVALQSSIAGAQSTNDVQTNLPAVMELMLPPGATATVDGKDAAEQRTFEFSQFSSNHTQRVEVAVKFSDATEAQRTVELEPGRHVKVPVNMPPVDQPTTVLTESPAPMLWAAFSPDSRWLATASENNSVVLWDLTAGRAVRNFSGHLDAVQSVVFSPDGKMLLTASTDTTAALWDVRSGRLIRKFKGHSAGVNSAVFSPDGKKILTGSSDNTAILWDAETGAQIRIFNGHTNEVVGVAISPDGRTIATASADRYAILWNADTGEKLFSLRTGDTVSGIVFSPDGKVVAASNFENDAYLWETATGKSLGTTRRVNLDINSVAFAPDGRRFFTAGKDATAKLWDTSTRQLVREFAGHSTDLQSVAPSPDGRLLLTSSRDGTVRLWDVATGTELVCLASSGGGKNWAVVAPDGLYDASESGRHMMGYRFAGKLPGAIIDQFFGQFYHPGLLAEIFHGERPMAPVQLGVSLPPQLKIVAPKVRSSTNEQVIVAVDAVDQGGGISAPQIFNNGARIAVEPETILDGDTNHYSFKLALARGVNQIRVTAATKDGSWEATPAEIELHCSRPLDRKSRLFVVAVGVGDYSEAGLNSNHSASDAKILADLLRSQSATLYDRVDVIPLFGKDAKRARIKDTLLDVADLSEPQDTVMLIFCGRGTMLGDHLYFAPQDLRFGQASRENDFRAQGFDGDELAAMLGTAKALNRVLILDAADISPASAEKKSSDFALRAAVERWSRSQGIYAIAACAAIPSPSSAEISHGLLARLLLDSAMSNGVPLPADSGGVMGVMEWFDAATQLAGPLMERLGLDPQELQQSTKTKSFPLLVVAR